MPPNHSLPIPLIPHRGPPPQANRPGENQQTRDLQRLTLDASACDAHAYPVQPLVQSRPVSAAFQTCGKVLLRDVVFVIPGGLQWHLQWPILNIENVNVSNKALHCLYIPLLSVVYLPFRNSRSCIVGIVGPDDGPPCLFICNAV